GEFTGTPPFERVVRPLSEPIRPSTAFYPGRVRSGRRLWLPREARRRVVRLALSRPVAIPLGGRHRGHGPAAPSLRRLAGIRDRRHAGGGGGPVARTAGVAAVWASADRRGLGFPRCRPDGGSLCARLESAGRAAAERRGWAGRRCGPGPALRARLRVARSGPPLGARRTARAAALDCCLCRQRQAGGSLQLRRRRPRRAPRLRDLERSGGRPSPEPPASPCSSTPTR